MSKGMSEICSTNSILFFAKIEGKPFFGRKSKWFYCHQNEWSMARISLHLHWRRGNRYSSNRKKSEPIGSTTAALRAQEETAGLRWGWWDSWWRRWTWRWADQVNDRKTQTNSNSNKLSGESMSSPCSFSSRTTLSSNLLMVQLCLQMNVCIIVAVSPDCLSVNINLSILSR